MIDRHLVSALVRSDLSSYRLSVQDARVIAASRVAKDVQRGLEFGGGSVTDEAASILAEANRRASLRSMCLAVTANRAAQVLDDDGIPALVYKGVAQAAEVHRDWRGRESSDVDVLVPAAAVTDVHRAFVRAGLARSNGDPSPPGAFRRFRSFEVPYVGLPSVVDLHWNVDSPGYYAVPFLNIWSRRRRQEIGGLSIWTLSRAEMLIVAALHGTREGWRSLRHILDFAQLAVNIEKEDWGLAEKLSHLGPERSLAIALAVADACGVQPLPARPGPWARKVAAEYLGPLDASLLQRTGPRGAVASTPQSALRRRMLRWKVAPSAAVASDALLRSGLRQVAYGKKRSWRLVRDRGASQADS